MTDDKFDIPSIRPQKTFKLCFCVETTAWNKDVTETNSSIISKRFTTDHFFHSFIGVSGRMFYLVAPQVEDHQVGEQSQLRRKNLQTVER